MYIARRAAIFQRISLACAIYFFMRTAHHLFAPGEAFIFTQSLLFGFFSVFPLVVLSAISIAVRSRNTAAEDLGRGRWVEACAAVAAIALILVAGVRCGVMVTGLTLAFVLPTLYLWATAPRSDLLREIGLRIAAYAAALIAGLLVTSAMRGGNAGVFADQFQHLNQLWPGYPGAARLFIVMCLFSLFLQTVELRAPLRWFFGLSQKAEGRAEVPTDCILENPAWEPSSKKTLGVERRAHHIARRLKRRRP